MPTRSAVLLAVLCIASSSGLRAQDPATASSEDIVVNGTKPTKQALGRFVDSITSEVDDQIPRFREPVCPASFGLPDAYNRVIEQRVRQDAARVGLRIADEKCDPNVVLIVADDPVPLVTALRHKRPQMFSGLDYSQILDVLRTKEPVRTWQAVQPRGSDGRPLQRIMSVPSPGGPPRAIGGAGAWANPAASNSRIEQNTQLELVASFIVIPANAIDGLTLTQIADYAAMRTFASTRAPPGMRGPTILALFNEGAPRASELTAWDLGYLRGIYKTSSTRAAHSQEAAISGAIRRELESAEPQD